MDFIAGNLPKAVSLAKEAYSDYERGKQVRLGSYRSPSEMKQLGHYNSSGKKLAIYHGR